MNLMFKCLTRLFNNYSTHTLNGIHNTFNVLTIVLTCRQLV